MVGLVYDPDDCGGCSEDILDDTRFRKREHLKRDEFKKVFTDGKRFSNRVLTVYALKGSERKVGFVVRRSIRSAVKRNRLKRLLREIFRQNRAKLCDKVLIVVVVGQKADGMRFSELESSFLGLLKKAGVLQ